MKPFYQGKIDTFCALYAVLNAFRLTHNIRALKARSLFNDTLKKLSHDEKAFCDVLDQTTDYIYLIDEMLNDYSKSLPIHIEKPFSKNQVVSKDMFWNTCEEWINADKNRTAIFRFFRYFEPIGQPNVRHWTTIESINETNLRLFDSSHEAESIQNISRNGYVTNEKDINKDVTIFIQTETLRLLRLPF